MAKRKRSAKQRIKSWRIGDYIRQFTIVAGGVLLTLWLTGRIAESARQKQVRQAMQLVALELRDNIEVIKAYEKRYNREKQIASRIREAGFSTARFSLDTIVSYSLIYGDLSKPYRLSTDALEMFKTSGVAADIADKQQIIDLLRCYRTLEFFDSGINLYIDERRKVMLSATGNQSFRDSARGETDYAAWFGSMTANADVRNWLGMIDRLFNDSYFSNVENQVLPTVSRIEEKYK